MKRGSLFGQTFISMVAISLAAVLATGYVARRALDSAFEAYLVSAGVHMGPGGGVGRQTMLGSAEQAFLAGVDRGIVVSALIAVILAAVAAWLLARYLLGPVRRLTSASQALAAGDLSHRVERRGPEEVAELAVEAGLPPGVLQIEISPLGVTNDVVINLQDAREMELAVALNALVQSVEYFDEHKDYEELQDVPAF